MTIGTYTSEILHGCNLDFKKDNQLIAKRNIVPPIPPWEQLKAEFDINYTDITKENNIHILTSYVRMHLDENYPLHLKFFTDGSIIDKKGGAGFFIPAINVKKSYSIRSRISILTAELLAIQMALEHLLNFPHVIHQILFCVDSKSALLSLKSFSMKIRPELVTEINHLIHTLSSRGSKITFCWIPSHCNIYSNEVADSAARYGALEGEDATKLNCPLSYKECCSIIDEKFRAKQALNNQTKGQQDFDLYTINTLFHKYIKNPFHVRQLTSLFCRWKTNSFRTKYVNSVKCICGDAISVDHSAA